MNNMRELDMKRFWIILVQKDSVKSWIQDRLEFCRSRRGTSYWSTVNWKGGGKMKSKNGEVG